MNMCNIRAGTMKLRPFILIAISLFFFSSCQIAGLTSGFSHLSKEEKNRVVKLERGIDEIQDYKKVYTITVSQIQEFTAKHNKVLVYDYTPFCKSELCVSLIWLSKFCSQNGVKLLVVSNIYDDLFTSIDNDFPILMIETDVYKTKWRSKYIDAFYKDLTGVLPKDVNYASYHYYANGVYVTSYKEPNTIIFE